MIYPLKTIIKIHRLNPLSTPNKDSLLPSIVLRLTFKGFHPK